MNVRIYNIFRFIEHYDSRLNENKKFQFYDFTE